MKKAKVLLSTMCTGIVGFVPASLISSCGATTKLNEVHLLSINDFHGAAPGYGDQNFDNTNYQNAGAIRLADETQKIISQYPGSKIVSCGDYNAGEAFSTVSHAETLYPVIKAMNITYSAVGNHEWEWGSENLENYHWDHLARTNETEGDYFVTSNVLEGRRFREKTWCSDESSFAYKTDYNMWKEHLIEWADPFKLLDMNGHNVCLIGLTTKGTLIDGNLNAIKDLAFIDYNASVTYTKTYAKEVLGEEKFNSIEAFILLTHCECQPNANDPTIIEGEAAELAKNATTRIDGILAAHSHRECAGVVKNEKLGNDVVICQASQAGRRYGDTTLKFDDSKPVGSRLASISMEIKTPNIDYAGLDPAQYSHWTAEERQLAFNAAAKQLETIKETTKNPIVQNTIEVFVEQSKVALDDLNEPIGTLTADLPYDYLNGSRPFGTVYKQTPTLLEPAGVWASKAQIWGFNHDYAQNIEAGEMLPVSATFFNLDSLKAEFKLDAYQEARYILKKEIFSLHSFENNIHYGCLTVDQIEQYINYFLEGANKFDYSEPKAGYGNFYDNPDQKLDEVKMTWNGDEDQGLIAFDDNEIVKGKDGEERKGVAYSCGPIQFYGISFETKIKDTRKLDAETTYNVYEYDPGTLKIYNPLNPENKFDQPETWTTGQDWKSQKINGGYIAVALSSFVWQGGNAQNRMLHHWFDYNESNSPDVRIAHQSLSQITRNCALEYAEYLKAEAKDFNDSIDNALIAQLIELPS